MPRDLVSKLTPRNPKPVTPDQDDLHPVSRVVDMDCGYAVLDRADPDDMFGRNRRGLYDKAYLGPNIDYDEE